MADSKIYNLVFHHKGQFLSGEYVGGESVRFACDEDKMSYFEIMGYLKDMGYESGFNIIAYSLTGDLLILGSDSEVQRAQHGHEDGSEINLYVLASNGEEFVQQYEIDEIYGKNFEGFELRRSPRKHKSSAPIFQNTRKKKLSFKRPRHAPPLGTRAVNMGDSSTVVGGSEEHVLPMETDIPAQVEETPVPYHVLETQVAAQVGDFVGPTPGHEIASHFEEEANRARDVAGAGHEIASHFEEEANWKIVPIEDDDGKDMCIDDGKDSVEDDDFWRRVMEEIDTPTPKKKLRKVGQSAGESSEQLITEPRKKSGSSKRSGDSSAASVAKRKNLYEENDPNAAVDIEINMGPLEEYETEYYDSDELREVGVEEKKMKQSYCRFFDMTRLI